MSVSVLTRAYGAEPTAELAKTNVVRSRLSGYKLL
jgi:hypothetical protein